MMRSSMQCVNSPRHNYSCFEFEKHGHFVQDAVILILEVQVEEITHANILTIFLGK